MKKTFISFIAKLMAVVLVFSAAPVYTNAAEELVYGDVNGDTYISADDALEVLKFSAKLIEFSETEFVLADVNDSGDVTARDALLILQYAAGLIKEFPVNSGEVTDKPADPTATPETPVTPTETADVTEAPAFESFPIEVITAGNIAEVDGTTITFKNPSNSSDGVLLDNPFVGKDTSEGLAISFWLRSSETISGVNYTFRSLITAMRENNLQAIKFDLEGTRQLSTVDGDKLNYWEASSAFLQVDEEYFITLTINENGLDYFVDGYSIGYSDFGGVNESTAYDTAMALLSLSGTTLYAGGVSSADAILQGDSRIFDHKIPEGTVMSDITGYIGNMTETDVEDLYLAVSKDHTPIPTVAPTTAPTATPEPVETHTPEPTATPDVTETPDATATPEPTGEVIPFSGTVYIASDSIADGYDNRMPEGGTDVVGWGNIFADYFTSDVTVKNEANLGDSTKSYYYDYDNDGDGDGHRYKAVYNNITKNDYVIICFGHNDGPANRDDVPVGANSSEKNSYQWYLKNMYIEPALAAGATPILMTPVVRNFYENGVFTEKDYHLAYGQAVRDLVAEYAAEGITIPLIDAQKYTYELYQTLSATEAAKYHATNDTTHYNQAGCERLCEYITSQLKTYNLGINQFIK